jgi:hypothetical protein
VHAKPKSVWVFLIEICMLLPGERYR